MAQDVIYLVECLIWTSDECVLCCCWVKYTVVYRCQLYPVDWCFEFNFVLIEQTLSVFCLLDLSISDRGVLKYPTIMTYLCLLAVLPVFSLHVTFLCYQGYIILRNFGPGWCGSVNWALACEPKSHRLDSQSGHMPGLLARSGPQWEVRERQPHTDVSLSLFLPPFPSL